MIARMPRLLATLAALLLCLAAFPAYAAVTITFWSHELGNHFPHTFFTLRGTPDAGGAPVDANYGFTPQTISPAILFGTVAGRIDIANPSYMAGSDAQFSLLLTDAQYAQVLRLVEQWDAVKGDNSYHMNTRNCVHFVQEAARRAGLTTLDFPKFMKKPRSYLRAVAAANPAQVVLIDRHGKDYLPTLERVVPPPIATAIPVN